MLPSIKLVAIDDTPTSLELVSESLQQEGLTIFTATDPEEGLDLIFQEHPQIVLLDLVMPKISGLEVLERVVEFDPAIDVILMTAHYTTETAVEAIQKGASDYLNKPISIPALRSRVEKLLADARQRQRALQLDSELLETSRFEGMIGRSPLMWDLFARIRRVAPHYRSALITGPTGTGKDLVAKALHNLSPANSGRFVTCNCSAVVETLFESELFGYVKGAFTGAAGDKMGLFEFAHGGTLFLDEIGDMPLSTQAKLLRALQNQEVHAGRIGDAAQSGCARDRGHQSRRAGFDRQKQFREDLYYRLAMVELRTPALADRREDLPLLEKFLLDRFATQFNKDIHGLTRRAQIVLARHSWPGNIRELENVLGHACMMAIGDTIDVEDLPASLRHHERMVGAAAGEFARNRGNRRFGRVFRRTREGLAGRCPGARQRQSIGSRAHAADQPRPPALQDGEIQSALMRFAYALTKAARAHAKVGAESMVEVRNIAKAAIERDVQDVPPFRRKP